MLRKANIPPQIETNGAELKCIKPWLQTITSRAVMVLILPIASSPSVADQHAAPGMLIILPHPLPSLWLGSNCSDVVMSSQLLLECLGQGHQLQKKNYCTILTVVEQCSEQGQLLPPKPVISISVNALRKIAAVGLLAAILGAVVFHSSVWLHIQLIFSSNGRI